MNSSGCQASGDCHVSSTDTKGVSHPQVGASEDSLLRISEEVRERLTASSSARANVVERYSTIARRRCSATREGIIARSLNS